jgi:hypothetical protein
MHEVSELVPLAAPIASVGGVAAMMRLMRVREARRVRRSTQPNPHGIPTQDAPEKTRVIISE